MAIDKEIKMSLDPPSRVTRLWDATISLPGRNEHERMWDLYQTGCKAVGYVNHARVACNIIGSQAVRANARRISVRGARSISYKRYSVPTDRLAKLSIIRLLQNYF